MIRLHKTKTPRNFLYISQEIYMYMLKSQNDVLTVDFAIFTDNRLNHRTIFYAFCTAQIV